MDRLPWQIAGDLDGFCRVLQIMRGLFDLTDSETRCCFLFGGCVLMDDKASQLGQHISRGECVGIYGCLGGAERKKACIA